MTTLNSSRTNMSEMNEGFNKMSTHQQRWKPLDGRHRQSPQQLFCCFVLVPFVIIWTTCSYCQGFVVRVPLQQPLNRVTKKIQCPSTQHPMIRNEQQPGTGLDSSYSRTSRELDSSTVPTTAATPTTGHYESSVWIQQGLESAALLDDVYPDNNIRDNSLRKSPMSNTFPASSSNEFVIGPSRVLIYDTTLRDGTQGESVSASVDDKLKIVSRLSSFGVDYIEAGWPGSNPKDAEFFRRAKNELSLQEKFKLVAFGSTCRKRVLPQDDAQVQALIESNTRTICIVAKSHSWQVTDILQTTLQENIRMIFDSVSYLHNTHSRNVMVDMEHFFDGYRMDPTYAMQCCEAAVSAGASCIVLCDTNGGTMPWDIASICSTVVQHFNHGTSAGVTVGIHCHNDCGMAVANSVMAANNGVGLIQGTINGIGERTGNADLCSIIPTLAFHLNKQDNNKDNNTKHDHMTTSAGSEGMGQPQSQGGSSMTCRTNVAELTRLSRFVDEILNRTPFSGSPYVGSSAFAHKGGLHVAAMERSPLSYQHIDPEWVGNKKRVLVSELSGRQNILGMMKDNNVLLQTNKNSSTGGSNTNHVDAEMSERALAIVQRVKDLEARGYTFEGADASVHLMILHSTKGYCAPFQVLDYTANVYDSNIDSATRVVMAQQNSQQPTTSTNAQARATVKIRTFNPPPNGLITDPQDNMDSMYYYKESLEVSDGNGPVDALAKALMRALVPSHPSLSTVELIDYKVRILDPASATRAATRVMIEFQDTATEQTWTTVSVDTNVISASLNALIDGYEYALIEHAQSCTLCDDFF